MNTLKKVIILSIVAIAGFLVGTFTNFSSSEPIQIAEAATPTVVTLESNEAIECYDLSVCDGATQEELFEADAYEALSKLPLHPLAASGNVGYKYIGSTYEASPEVQAPYFYVYSANEPGLKHLMMAEVLYKA